MNISELANSMGVSENDAKNLLKIVAEEITPSSLINKSDEEKNTIFQSALIKAVDKFQAFANSLLTRSDLKETFSLKVLTDIKQ
tara:strand:+ start:68 stop:319 length:252 start_codon:yes stop_codon:yes gene_type:complete